MTRTHRALSAVVFSLCGLYAADASAQTALATPAAVTAALSPTVTPRVPPPTPLSYRVARRPYRLNFGYEVPVIVASAALWILPDNMQPEIVRLGRCPCDPATLNDIDRPWAGVSIPNSGDPSNVATALLLTAPAVFDMFDVWLSGGTIPEWFEDTIVIGEALMVGGALDEIVKLSFQRPRPGAYGLDPASPALNNTDTYLSFYSLSGAEVFTAATAGAVTYALRHPHGPWRWVYLGVAETLAAGFAVSRVLVGKHFPTDVMAATAVGTALGMVIPLLHERQLPLTLGGMAMPGGAMFSASVPLP